MATATGLNLTERDNRTVYTLHAEFGWAYAWVKRHGNNVGSSLLGPNIADSQLGWGGDDPVSAELERDLGLWQRWFEREVSSEGYRDTRFDWDAFNKAGFELAKRLKAELGAKARVFYRKPSEDPSEVCCQEWEVLEDFEVVERAYRLYSPDEDPRPRVPRPARNRSRRLRKKLRVDEFQELGFRLFAELSADADYNRAFDAFIGAIEGQGLEFGGRADQIIDGFVCRARRGSATEACRAAMAEWLSKRDDVVDWWIGRLEDAWYPGYVEVDRETLGTIDPRAGDDPGTSVPKSDGWRRAADIWPEIFGNGLPGPEDSRE